MAPQIPNLELNNGQKMPIIGLGTWQSPKGQVAQAVSDAIDAGYRHLDCAFIYGNEAEIGESLTAKIADGTVKREDVFITSKVWNTYHRPDLVRECLQETLKRLNTPYLDLYLIHWPQAFKEGGDVFPKNEAGEFLYSDVQPHETWKAMETLVDDGLVKSIGVSNFNKRQIEKILSVARIKPVINQIETHPYLTQDKLIPFMASHGIKCTAYSPLGSPQRPMAREGDPAVLDDPKIKELAAKYNKSPAQILIRYQIDKGNSVIPKSVTKERIISNFNVFDFQLSSDDLNAINALNRNLRYCVIKAVVDHPNYPFNDEY